MDDSSLHRINAKFIRQLEKLESEIKEAKKAAQWPYVEGIITRSKTIETVKKDYNVDLGGSIQRNKNIVNADYCADIEYKYVAGNAALLSKLDMGLRCSKKRSDIEKLVKRYPLGKIVRVYYNPKNPGDSTLEIKVPPSLYGGLALGVVFIVIGAGLGFYFLVIYLRNSILKNMLENAKEH
jgi:hypothetical protein